MDGARSRNFEARPLFEHGFRPFVLLATLQAGQSVRASLP